MCYAVLHPIQSSRVGGRDYHFKNCWYIIVAENKLKFISYHTKCSNDVDRYLKLCNACCTPRLLNLCLKWSGLYLRTLQSLPRYTNIISSVTTFS